MIHTIFKNIKQYDKVNKEMGWGDNHHIQNGSFSEERQGKGTQGAPSDLNYFLS